MTGPLINDPVLGEPPKSMFLSPLQTKYLGYHRRTQWWELTAELRYWCSRTGAFIAVPEGFVCDFASVRRVPGIWLLWGGKAHRAAVIHDYLYREGRFGRIMTDRIFRDAMEVTGYRAWSRWPMFWGVYLGGWTAYKPTPGCLDYRFCEHNRNPAMCPGCEQHKG